PNYLNFWIIASTVTVMVTLAVAIEVALYFSNKLGVQWIQHLCIPSCSCNQGFIPTLAIGPLVWIWKRIDNDLRRPYVTMSQGFASSEESVLLDLEHWGLLDIFSVAFRHGLLLIIGSSLICIVNILLHPMAGSFFLVKPGITVVPSSAPVQSTTQIGLNPAYKDLSSFVAAAGFAEAAAVHNLSNPPFIQGDWAVAQFKLPSDAAQNTTITVSTTGVQTNVTCSVPHTSNFMPPTSSSPHNWTLQASVDIGSGCTFLQSIDSTLATNQYGVEAIPGCSANTLSDPFVPVFFWFYNEPPNGNGTPVASTVFCAPTISAYAVAATVDVGTGLLVEVNVTGNLDRNDNNVTTGAFAGKAFNGVSFDSSSDFNLTDPFVLARALAVQSGVPGAIFRVASDPSHVGGLSTFFQNSSGFLSITEQIYTQHLSLVASANYFVPTGSSLNAVITSWPNRLWINPRSAHFLAALLILVGVTGAIIHISHRRKRTRLYLASHPGSMAHHLSLFTQTQTSRSADDIVNGAKSLGLVGPLDNDRTMKEKLKGFRFTFDQRTGRVVAVLPGEGMRQSASWKGEHEVEATLYEMEDTTKSLLDRGFNEYDDPFDHKSRLP
ncbi:hypothetical protein K439DRAFT_1349965, partial [Ramaria rubella]